MVGMIFCFDNKLNSMSNWYWMVNSRNDTLPIFILPSDMNSPIPIFYLLLLVVSFFYPLNSLDSSSSTNNELVACMSNSTCNVLCLLLIGLLSMVTIISRCTLLSGVSSSFIV